MKFILFICLLSTSAILLSCESRPLSNLREMYEGLDKIKHLHELGSTKRFMYNHAIADDDVEVLSMYFTYGRWGVTYEDLLLSQANRGRDEPVHFRPLHLAAQYGALRVMDFCMDHGADPNSRTHSEKPEYDQNTPVHIAVMSRQHKALEKLLSHRQILPFEKNRLGKTAEDIAAEKKDTKSLELLEAFIQKYGRYRVVCLSGT